MKKQFLSLTLFLFTMAAGSNAQSRQGYTYSVPSAPWEESFGNHRAVLQVDQPDEVTALEFEWRRPDKDVDRKRYLIIHAETGDTVPNIKRLEVYPCLLWALLPAAIVNRNKVSDKNCFFMI